ncbi:phosphopantetheine-binding protein [Flavobacterium sp.]|jgi:acyl carrier protein|uniref:phosphopantetheine-binding protein n=1 Tax=Flavobacterium sp. TaxID=239 RepID=UPI0037C09E3A
MIDDLKEILKPYVQDVDLLENLDLKTNFINDLHINSAALVDIILDIEDRFDIIVSDEGMQEIMTVKAALNVIEQELAKK